MSNPNNVCVFQGEILTEPRFIENKAGAEWACEFFLGAERNFRNQGVFLCDNIPLRLEGEAIMAFAKTLEVGDEVRVISAYTTKTFTQNGVEKQKSYFLISDIKTIRTNSETGDGFVELPI